MNKIVKIICVAIAAALLLGGCAYGGEKPEASGEATTTTAAVTTSATEEVAATTAAPDEPETTTATDAPVASADTPFGKHGALSVNGTDLVDASGEKIQLYGMSTHGIAWFPQYVSLETFTTLRDDWNTNCVRISMYTAENSGYCTGGNQDNLKELVRNGVEYATELGMYVIIDWHILREETPLLYKDEAIAFFDEMSKLYADRDNIIYEICNEPNGSGSWSAVKEYANEVIPVIRANDPNSVILVGTPTWSQDIDQALDSPLDYDNLMYTLHFYAATHTDWLRNRMKQCIDSGLPVFISEFGTCDASGSGAIDYEQSEAWKDIIEEYNVSFFCWNLANNKETSSVIDSSCKKTSGWTDDELSDQGKWITEWFRSETRE